MMNDDFREAREQSLAIAEAVARVRQAQRAVRLAEGLLDDVQGTFKVPQVANRLATARVALRRANRWLAEAMDVTE